MKVWKQRLSLPQEATVGQAEHNVAACIIDHSHKVEVNMECFFLPREA